MADIVTRIKAYHLPDGEGGEDILEPVTPVKPPTMRFVAMSESDAEVLGQVGNALCTVGAIEAGLTLVGISAAWKVAT